jgi:IS5 family transposase
MKAHIGVDCRSKPIHSVVATAANVADATLLPDLLRGDETGVWGDPAYRGQREAIRDAASSALDFTNRRYWHRGVVNEAESARNRTKAKVRAKVESCFGVIKRVFGFTKERYRGVDKDARRLFVTCALANLFMLRSRSLRT